MRLWLEVDPNDLKTCSVKPHRRATRATEEIEGSHAFSPLAHVSMTASPATYPSSAKDGRRKLVGAYSSRPRTSE